MYLLTNNNITNKLATALYLLQKIVYGILHRFMMMINCCLYKTLNCCFDR